MNRRSAATSAHTLLILPLLLHHLFVINQNLGFGLKRRFAAVSLFFSFYCHLPNIPDFRAETLILHSHYPPSFSFITHNHFCSPILFLVNLFRFNFLHPSLIFLFFPSKFPPTRNPKTGCVSSRNRIDLCHLNQFIF